MIHLILQGGLGNQMFEYATALAIAKENNQSIELDRSFFDIYNGRDWCRPFGLDIFRLHNHAIYTHRYPWLVRILPKINIWCRKHGMQHIGPLVFELNNPHNSKAPNPILFGYFTNVHVFDKYADGIRQVFAFNAPPNKDNMQLIQQMQSCNSVSIHIRRGDYLNTTNSGFAKNGENWYRRAIQEMTKHVNNPHWFFFSDDIDWCKQTFSNIINATFVDINHGSQSYNDMRLMAHCQHNIIANSTFSWWGAWLNTNPDKIVIAPQSYYKDPIDNKVKYLDKMIPKGWIILE